MCLELSTVDVPGLDYALTLSIRFNVIPGSFSLGRGRPDANAYLVEVDPRRFPKQKAFSAMIGSRLPPRQRAAADRRRSCAAFGLALVISASPISFRLARAGFVFAREGVLGLVDPARSRCPRARRLPARGLIERPFRGGDKATGLSPSR